MIKYDEAVIVAKKLLEELKPHCYKISIAGSIRRCSPLVKDIEIVAVPKPYEIGLFASGVASVIEKFPVIKGKLPCKYTQRMLPEGIVLDLFLCDLANYGLQLAIRTGPAEYSHKVLATGWVRKGFHCEKGYLHKNGKPIGVLEEQDLYKLIGVEYTLPYNRRV